MVTLYLLEDHQPVRTRTDVSEAKCFDKEKTILATFAKYHVHGAKLHFDQGVCQNLPQYGHLVWLSCVNLLAVHGGTGRHTENWQLLPNSQHQRSEVTVQPHFSTKFV